MWSTTQVEALHRFAEVDVIGCNVILSSGPASGVRERVKQLPCHPVWLRWQMLFYCAVAHPTVVARAKVRTAVPVHTTRAPCDWRSSRWIAIVAGMQVIRDLGGYDVESDCAEDYDLWLRALFPARSGVESATTGTTDPSAGTARAGGRVATIANLGQPLLRLYRHGALLCHT